VKDKTDFIQRFDEIFDAALIDRIAKSRIEDWAEVGWRGIMFDDGTIWIDDDGEIGASNYQSAKEKQLLINAIRAGKNELPKSLQDFEKPRYLILTKNYKIRIDEKSEGSYRYAAWKIMNKNSEPDIALETGVLEFQGSGGNHTITFKNDDYTYVISIIKMIFLSATNTTNKIDLDPYTKELSTFSLQVSGPVPKIEKPNVIVK
jgi:hypothetical protein